MDAQKCGVLVIGNVFKLYTIVEYPDDVDIKQVVNDLYPNSNIVEKSEEETKGKGKKVEKLVVEEQTKEVETSEEKSGEQEKVEKSEKQRKYKVDNQEYPVIERKIYKVDGRIVVVEKTLRKTKNATSYLFIISEEVENNKDGVEFVAKKDLERLIVAGNYRWGLPFVVTLRSQNPDLELWYHPRPKIEVGQRASFDSVAIEIILKILVNKHVKLRKYFAHRKRVEQAVPSVPTTYILAKEYLDCTNKIRIVKHKIYHIIRLIAPELLEEAKKELLKHHVLTDYIFSELERRKNDDTTLSYYVFNNNKDWYEEQVKKLREFNEELKRLIDNKNDAFKKLRSAVGNNHPFLIFCKKFKKRAGSVPDTAYILVAMLGWYRGWNYHKMSEFVGIATHGNPHISRVRPEIRQYIYLFMKGTKLGEFIFDWFKNDYPVLKAIIVKIKKGANKFKQPEVSNVSISLATEIVSKMSISLVTENKDKKNKDKSTGNKDKYIKEIKIKKAEDFLEDLRAKCKEIKEKIEEKVRKHKNLMLIEAFVRFVNIYRLF